MGNCLVLENRVIKIVRSDGKVLEYTKPTRVHEILAEFSGHNLIDALSNTQQHLNPEAKLLCGRLYYLVPLPLETPRLTKKTKTKKKRVRFASPEVEPEAERSREGDDDEKSVKVVRVKIVVSKQELQKLLEGGSVQEMVYQTLDKQDLECGDNKGWRPELDSIPELDL